MNHGNDGLAEVASDLDEFATFHLLVFIGRLSLLGHQVSVPLTGRVKSALERIRIDYTKLLEHDETRRGFFVFFVGKLAIVKAEQLVLLSKEVWKHLDEVVVLMLVDFGLPAHTTVHEHISLAAMAMHVAEKYDLVLSVVSCN